MNISVEFVAENDWFSCSWVFAKIWFFTKKIPEGGLRRKSKRNFFAQLLLKTWTDCDAILYIGLSHEYLGRVRCGEWLVQPFPCFSENKFFGSFLDPNYGSGNYIHRPKIFNSEDFEVWSLDITQSIPNFTPESEEGHRGSIGTPKNKISLKSFGFLVFVYSKSTL